MADWIEVCGTDDIDTEDLIRWDHGERSFAIYNTEKGFFATDGFCTHEAQHLENGLVIGLVIECPLHGGRFDIATGKALSAPVCVNLVTYPVEARGGRLFIRL
jgi:3-phenylpropionate/trans-cinnamate dioxygenase ferredoxin component